MFLVAQGEAKLVHLSTSASMIVTYFFSTRLDLQDLQVVAFTEDEIAKIIQESPADRAPGPDGFTGSFG